MWDIGKNSEKERYCFCGGKETIEYNLECVEVMELIKGKAKKEWLENDKSVECHIFEINFEINLLKIKVTKSVLEKFLNCYSARY